MTSITTHVLDVSRGRPAEGIAVRLERRDGAAWRPAGSGRTNADGRVQDLGKVERGVYRLVFDVAGFYEKSFYPEVAVAFEVSDDRHHHVPLLLSPFGYSTYRGS